MNAVSFRADPERQEVRLVLSPDAFRQCIKTGGVVSFPVTHAAEPMQELEESVEQLLGPFDPDMRVVPVEGGLRVSVHEHDGETD